MHTHFTCGAINKETTLYEYPAFADKKNNYACPYCKHDVILRQGEIRVHHFAHKSENNSCSYYTNPTGKHVISDAKLIIESCFKKNIPIHITQNCSYTRNYHNSCKKTLNTTIQCDENISIALDHKFTYNDYDNITDIAIIDNSTKQMIYTLECYSDKTYNNAIESSVLFSRIFNRSGPCFKINADEIISKYNSDMTELNIQCTQNYLLCDPCKELYKIEEEKNKVNDDKRKLMRQRLQQLRERRKNK